MGFRDDLTGQPLDPVLVREARQKELDYFEAKKVWVRKDIGEARRVTGKPPISVRWVDVNKGDDREPNIRSRLVARQIRQAGEEAIFAPTPPLEALEVYCLWLLPTSRSSRSMCETGHRKGALKYRLWIFRGLTLTLRWMMLARPTLRCRRRTPTTATNVDC